MFLVYFLLWIIFNERVTLEVALIGLIVCAAVDLFSVKILGKLPRKKLKTCLRLTVGVVKYGAALIREVFRCNVAVIRLILSPRYEIEPELHYFKTRLKTDAARVMLADSITLTPGTITCGLEDDRFCVHALDASMAEGIESTDFEKRLSALEEIAHES